jgi:hypothetical protein
MIDLHDDAHRVFVAPQVGRGDVVEHGLGARRFESHRPMRPDHHVVVIQPRLLERLDRRGAQADSGEEFAALWHHFQEVIQFDRLRSRRTREHETVGVRRRQKGQIE